jgi:hypothetical protein
MREKRILVAVNRHLPKKINGIEIPYAIKATFIFAEEDDIEENFVDIVVAMNDLEMYTENGELTNEAYSLSKKIHEGMKNWKQYKSLGDTDLCYGWCDPIISSSVIKIERMMYDSDHTFSIMCDQDKIESLAYALETWQDIHYTIDLYDHIKDVFEKQGV